ncbi:MAG: BamA/OMP85 family outer membrane protein [Armatimonadota bacterium]|jgi:outer membrane protein insertion porin family
MKSTVRIAAVVALAALTCAGVWGQADRPLIGEVVVEGNDFVAREPIIATVQDVLRVGEEYTEVKATEAIQLVRRMGYFDEVAVSTEPMEQGVRVVITVVEKQRIEQMLFVGNTTISDAELAAEIISQPGHVYDERSIARDVRRIEEYYESRGFIAKVSEARLDDFGALTFVIEEARIEDIIIEGLDRTKPWVVRREMDLEPGELFQQRQISTAIRRIYAMGLFEEVETELRPGIENPLRDVILVIQVKEARTGRAAFALGWSSLDDLVIMLSAEERNLRGQGERASVSLELGGRESYELSFTDPYLDDRGTTFEINLYDSERRRQFVGGAAISTADGEFDERRTGGDFTVIRPIAERRSVSLTVRSVDVSSSALQGTKVLPPDVGRVGVAQVNQPLQDDDGNPVPSNPDLLPDHPEPGDMSLPIRVAAPLHPGGRVNSLKFGVIDDTRDVRSNPRSGALASLTFEQAGALLGGGTEFGKITADYRRYFGVGDDVVALRLMAGTSFGSPPLFESFTVGGANTLRGYEPDRWRGESLLLGNAEYRRRINDSLTAVGFIDIGSAYGGTFETVVPGFSIQAADQSFEPHVGVGAGLRVVTPIGPIRLDMGFGEEGSQAHFSFGHTF